MPPFHLCRVVSNQNVLMVFDALSLGVDLPAVFARYVICLSRYLTEPDL